MGKREVVSFNEAWWVWIGDDGAVDVENEEQARDMLLKSGQEYKDYDLVNGRPDFACPVVEIRWNDKLPAGETYHKTVVSPLTMVLHKGKIRKMIAHISPSKLAFIGKSWYALEPKFPAWLPNQYMQGYNNPEVCILKGKKSVVEQLNDKFK